MNNEESKRKTKLVKEANKSGMYARRIEDQYGVGILDMIFCPKIWPPVVFFAEGKLVDRGSFKPTSRQWVEMIRIAVHEASIPCIIGFDGDEMYLHASTKHATIEGSVKRLPGESVQDWFARFYKEKLDYVR